MANKTDNSLIIAGAGMAMVYFGILKPLTDMLGLTKNKEEKDREAAINTAKSLDAWHPNFWREVLAKGPRTLNVKFFDNATAEKLARQINKGWGLFNDNEQKISSVFAALKSQMDLSRVAEKYSLLFKKDLRTDLQQRGWYGLSDKEFEKHIAFYVNKLPVYIKK